MVEKHKFKLKALVITEQKEEAIKLCDDAFNKPVFQRDNYKELFEKIDKHAEFIVACDEETQGYIAFYANDDISKVAYVTLLAVRPQFQNMHIGGALLENAQDVASDKGMRFIRLEVNKKNKNAIRFYQKHGFVPLYDTEESIYMQKELLARRG